MKLGIIRCMQTEDYCPGTTDFKAIKDKIGAFADEDNIELVGFTNCGGCPGKRAVLRARLLKSRGADIATYMKEYRVHRAMKLLRETDATIADIAARVGYETQGKFSKAFKDVVQVLPTEYRKMQYQK